MVLQLSPDCGIKSIDHVAYAKERKIDFIICPPQTWLTYRCGCGFRPKGMTVTILMMVLRLRGLN
jgi:hypothetical protein